MSDQDQETVDRANLVNVLIEDVQKRLISSSFNAEPESHIRHRHNNDCRRAASEWATILLGLKSIEFSKNKE